MASVAPYSFQLHDHAASVMTRPRAMLVDAAEQSLLLTCG